MEHLPFELPFEIQFGMLAFEQMKTEEIRHEWSKIRYTEHYIEFAEDIIHSRFPGGDYDHIPGMDIVFETMVENLKVTPLEAWEKQKFQNNNKIISKQS